MTAAVTRSCCHHEDLEYVTCMKLRRRDREASQRTAARILTSERAVLDAVRLTVKLAFRLGAEENHLDPHLCSYRANSINFFGALTRRPSNLGLAQTTSPGLC